MHFLSLTQVYGVCSYGTILLLIDDLHLFDLLSWQLLLSVCSQVQESCMVVATIGAGQGILDASQYRSHDTVHVHRKASQILTSLMELPDMSQVKLRPLTGSEIMHMMCALLSGCNVHRSNADVVLHQTHGQPVHVEEVIYYMASLGVAAHSKLETPGGLMSSDLCTISASSVSHVILSRIDQLRPPQQLTLKVCSVVGSTVTLDSLIETYPLAFESHVNMKHSLESDMRQLCDENFLQVDLGHPHRWKWHSAAAQEVAYNVIPFNQRRLLHGRLAQALEDDRLSITAPLPHIAHHWTESCANVEVVESSRTMNAVRCWKLSAQEAALKGSNLDAVRFMTHSIELSKLLANSWAIRMDRRKSDDISNFDWVHASEMSEQHLFTAQMYLQEALTEPVWPCILLQFHDSEFVL